MSVSLIVPSHNNPPHHSHSSHHIHTHSSSHPTHSTSVHWITSDVELESSQHGKQYGQHIQPTPSTSTSTSTSPSVGQHHILLPSHHHSSISVPSTTIMHASPSSVSAPEPRASMSKDEIITSTPKLMVDVKSTPIVTTHNTISTSSQTTPNPRPQSSPNLHAHQPHPSPSPSPSPSQHDSTLLAHPQFRTFQSNGSGHAKMTLTPSTDAQVTNNKDASMSSLGLDDSIPSLHLDTPPPTQVTTQHVTPIDIERSIHWGLTFTDPHMEMTFRQSQSQFTTSTILHLIIAILSLLVVGLYRDIARYSDDHDGYGRRLAYLCTGAILMVIVCGLVALRSMTRRIPLFAIALIFTLAGAFWAVGGVIANDRTLSPTQSMYLIYFLIIGHLIGHIFLFSYIFLSSWIIVIIYTITTFIYRSIDESIMDPAINVTTLCLCNIILCYASYQYESHQRYTYRLELQSNADRQRLHKEATELREEVYALVLEKFDIADVETNIDLKSPLEKAMALLQMMEREKTLSKENFTRVKQVIELLGTSSDIFRPKVEQVLGEKNTLDDDTTKWLISLVEDDGHHNNDNSPERKLVAIDGSLQSQSSATPGLRGLPGTTSDINVSLASEEELTFSKIQSQLDEWNFDVFEVARLTKGRPLFYMCMTLFRKFNFIQKFNLDKDKLCNFLNTIESGYHNDKPYHNSTHAADVTRTVNFFLARGGLKSYCTDLEMMAAIVASAIHDFDHPGVGNNFLVRLRDEKAVLYNDKSVLENHHVANAYKQMLKPENNLFSSLTTKQFDEARKIIIEMVLATDLSHHFEFVGHFKAAMSKIDTASEQSRLMVLKMSLKCADVGHAAKAVSLHVKWTQRVIEEFYRQGDEERKANIPISPFMDRRKANVPKAQVGFIDFLVYPMYDSFSTYLNLPPSVIPCLAELQNNREYWKRLST